jgi:aryl carrier-like protein
VLVAQSPAALEGASVSVSPHGHTATRAAEPLPARVAEESAAEAFATRLAAAAAHEREELLVDYVRRHIAALLRLESPERIDRRGRLMDLGLDSLMAVELRSRLGRGLALDEPLPATLIFDCPTVDAITELLQRRLQPGAPAEADVAVPVAAFVDSTTPDLDALTDEEVEARLLARLASLEGRAP